MQSLVLINAKWSLMSSDERRQLFKNAQWPTYASLKTVILFNQNQGILCTLNIKEWHFNIKLMHNMLGWEIFKSILNNNNNVFVPNFACY